MASQLGPSVVLVATLSRAQKIIRRLRGADWSQSGVHKPIVNRYSLNTDGLAFAGSPLSTSAVGHLRVIRFRLTFRAPETRLSPTSPLNSSRRRLWGSREVFLLTLAVSTYIDQSLTHCTAPFAVWVGDGISLGTFEAPNLDVRQPTNKKSASP